MTPVEPFADLLPEIDMLLLMTVEPGFGGQPFLDMVLPKLRRARALVSKHGAGVWLQVDGGVSADTIERCADAGADVFVAGSAVYSADDPAAAVQALRAQAQRATAHASWPDGRLTPVSVESVKWSVCQCPGRSYPNGRSTPMSGWT